jgi:DNA-binding PadR family transcriptional regulator
MSAKHALLGLLRDGPGNHLERRLGPTWAVNSGQLSQTMKRMQEEGLIERVGSAKVDRDERQIFVITAKGVQEFEQWYEASRQELRLARRSLLVKIMLGGPAQLTEALNQVDAYEHDATTRLQAVSREREKIAAERSTVRRDDIVLRLSLSADVGQAEAELTWAGEAREAVTLLLEHEAIWPSGRAQARAMSDEERARQQAREELFGEMAARHMRSKPGRQGRDRAD